MNIKNTLTGIVIASTLALGVTGCNYHSNEFDNLKEKEKALVQYNTAEDRLIIGHGAIQDMSDAAYHQELEIIENNSKILNAKNLNVDISTYLNNARKEHEKMSGLIIGYKSNYHTSKAAYYAGQAILLQQEALMK